MDLSYRSRGKGQAHSMPTKQESIQASWQIKLSWQTPSTTWGKCQWHSIPQSYPGVNLCPGIRAMARIRASGQDNVSGQSGRTAWSGSQANKIAKPIRAVGQNSLSGQSGKEIYPGSRAQKSIQAVGQNNLSGQSGRTVYPASRATHIYPGRKASKSHIVMSGIVNRKCYI